MRTGLLLTLLLSYAPLLWCQTSALEEAAQYQNLAAAQLLNGDDEGAIRQLGAAAAIYKSAGEWEYYFSCLNQATNAYLSIGKMDEAKRTAKKALWESIQRLGRDNDEAAKAAHRLAEVYSRAGRHAKAIEVHKMGLMIRESIYGSGHPKLAASYDWIARAWAAAVDFGKAAEYYNRALDLRKASLGAQHPDVAISFTNLARLEQDQKHYSKALNYHYAALGIRKARLGRQHLDAASSLISMARINRILNKPRLAEQQYEEAALIFQQNMDSKGAEAAEAYQYLATINLNKGNLPAAARYGRQAVKALALGPETDAGLAYRNHLALGTILMEMGRHEEAALSFQQAIASGGSLSLAGCYQQWSEALRLSGRLDAAAGAARAYLEWAERRQMNYAIPDARAQLGLLLVETGKPEEGIRQLAAVLNNADAPYWLLQEASLALGDAYGKLGQHEQAIQQYQQLKTELGQSRRAGALFLRFRVLQALGTAHSSLALQDRNAVYNLEAALDAYKNCDNLIFQLAHAPLPRAQFVHLAEAQHQLYSNAIRDCHSLYQQNQDKAYLRQAFYYAERSKRLSVQLPLLLLPPSCFSQAPKRLLEQEAEQRGLALARHRALKSSFYNGEGTDSLQNEIAAGEEQYMATLSRLKQEAPKYYQLKFGGEVVGLDELDAILQEQSAALYAYFAGETYLYVFFANGNGLQLFRRRMDEEFLAGLNAFLELILNEPVASPEGKRPEAFRQFARQAVLLYEELIPVSPGLASQQLLLLPHGPLQWLPFEALLPAAPKGSNFANLPYLGISHRLLYFSSASAWKEALENPSRHTYEAPFAAFVSPGPNGRAAIKESYASGNNPSLSYFLEPARKWAAKTNGSAWEGPTARKAAFRKLPPAETLLLAVHASISGIPANTFLSFSEVKDSIYDNRLYLKEIYGLQKPVELYILASAMPQPGQLPGWQQLAEALRYSGCQSLLLHRWPATGQPSAALLQLFLSRWQEGGSAPQGLLEARREYLAAQAALPEKAHPHFWAGFLYYGPPGTSAPSPLMPGYWIIAAVAGLIFIGWLMRLK